MVIGGVAGYSVTEHVWDTRVETESVAGLVLGGFVDVQTPLRWLTAGAEATYSQRGSDARLQSGGMPVTTSIRSDYLTFMIRARVAVPLGPARFHVAAGPFGDFLLRNRIDPLLAQVLDRPSEGPFGVHVGAGVGAWVTPRVFVELEARLVEGIQSSYEGAVTSVRNRSRELVARVGLSR